MKKWILLGVAAAGVIALLFVSRQSPQKKQSACRSLIAACETAGYKRGPTKEKRKEFRNECLKPLLETGSFQGTTFDPKIVEDCRARLDRRKNRAGRKDT